MLPSVARLLIRPGSRVRIAFVCMYVRMYVANASGMQSNVAPAWPCLLGALLLSGRNSVGFSVRILALSIRVGWLPVPQGWHGVEA